MLKAEGGMLPGGDGLDWITARMRCPDAMQGDVM